MKKKQEMVTLSTGILSYVKDQPYALKHLAVMLIIGGFITACDSAEKEVATDNSITNEKPVATHMLTDEEIQQGWIMLFDGGSTDGWRGYNQDSFPSGKWVIDNGTLHLNSAGSGEGGDILYDQKFHNFRLSLEWKISEGGNSGIFYLGQELKGEPIWKTAPEMQILDNEGHPDATRGIDGNRKAGALYDLLPANPQNTRPAGEWNHAEILVDQGNVVHFQNGESIVEFNLESTSWDRMIADSKFADLPEFGIHRPGYIALQDHGDDVWFRNIKILPLE